MKGGAGTRGDFAGDGKSGWSASIQTILTGGKLSRCRKQSFKFKYGWYTDINWRKCYFAN